MNNKLPKTVLHVIGSSQFGGGTMVVFSLASAAAKLGWKPAILSDDPTTITEAQKIGLEVIKFHGIIRPVRPWIDFTSMLRLKAFLKENPYSVVHTHTLKGGLVGRLAAYKAKIPVIVHHNHGFSFQDSSSIIRKKTIASLERFSAKYCDRIISVNSADVELATKWNIAPQGKMISVPNGINQTRIDAIAAKDKHLLLQELKIADNSLVLTILARLVAEKGHPWLFKAMPEIERRLQRPVHLLLLGDGPDTNEFKIMVEQLNISDRVHFLGYRPDCIALAKACDIFVLPSLREGHSITIIEAMASNIPIVATDIRGINNSVNDNETALLVPVRSDAALADAICRLATDHRLYHKLRENARQRFVSNFTEEIMTNKVINVYEQVAKEKHLFF